MHRLLIANRGEIAIRLIRACADNGIASVAIFSADDINALHRMRADEAVAIPGRGAKAYLDIDAIVAAAIAAGCDAVHPGYGFLSESASFARTCADAGLIFVGPAPETLELFGNKARALDQARRCAVPVPRGTAGPTSLRRAQAFFGNHARDGMMIKALSGGGGRGMRAVFTADDVPSAWERCSSEALAAFGCGDVYVEELIGKARHIEIQIVGDGTDVTHLFDRECSVQRRHQKLIEVAPSPWLPQPLREEIIAAALRIGKASGYRGVGTVEFLVEIDEEGACTGRYLFIELNPRIQVEHTVTEEVTGVDIVGLQLKLAEGAKLADLAWKQPADRLPNGFAIQCRINMEEIEPDGSVLPSDGTLRLFDLPSGAGVRIETLGYQGFEANMAFDSLLAKVIVHAPAGFPDAVARGRRALSEFRIAGVATNTAFLQAILADADFQEGRADTRFIEQHIGRLVASAASCRTTFPAQQAADERVVDNLHPLPTGPIIQAPMRGHVTSFPIEPGGRFAAGQVVAVIEAMKMEHVIRAEESGIVLDLLRAPGSLVEAGSAILSYEAADAMPDAEGAAAVDAVEPDDGMRDAIDDLRRHKHALLDMSRPAAVAMGERRGMLTARQRIEHLVDAESFVEFGGLARNPEDDADALADGIVTGRALIDARPVLLLSQDFSVFGGSAGHLGMRKMERIAELAERHGLPLVMLLDGGGHRIQDGQNSRDYAMGAPLFQNMMKLSGWVPVVAVMLGAGFAANTNFAACADFVIMVRGKAVMGLAGPALVKAGTGETITAELLGGAHAQVDRHGLAHLGVDSEGEAFDAVRRYLGFLPSNAGESGGSVIAPGPDAAPDPDALTNLVPVNTRQGYDVRDVVRHIADVGSFFEIKPTYAANLVVGFARLAGRAVGFIANQPLVKAGMLDAPACEKGAHFVAVCDAFGLPLIYLIDVPGFSIGSGAEASTLGRRSARMLYELGGASVPRLSVVLRKGYGLAYIAMCGGRSFGADLALAWPTAEICAMSVEGSVDIAYRKDYETADDPAQRRRQLIDMIRARVSPLMAAEGFGIDDLIEPSETRTRLIDTLASVPVRHHRAFRGIRTISPI